MLVGRLRFVGAVGWGSTIGIQKEKQQPVTTSAIVEVLGLHSSLVRLDDGAAQGQADAHAIGLGGIERLVQALHHFGRNARARVAHHELDHRLVIDVGLRHPEFDDALRRRALRRIDRLGGVFQQVDQHLLDQDRVHQQLGQLGHQVLVESDVAPPQFDFCQFHRLGDHGVHVGQGAVGFAAFHKGADALDDLAGTLRLLCRFFQRAEQVFLVDLLALDARHHAIAIIVDGGQRLVEFMRHAGGHFAHGDQAAGGLRAFGLRLRLVPRHDAGR